VPIHDWTRVDAGLFHAFHLSWIVKLCDALNSGPPDKPLIVAAYEAGRPPTAYVEPIAVGETLPEMPFFLGPGSYVPAPLDATYQMAWIAFPTPLKPFLDRPRADPPREC
jgi:hypothetical protein